METRVDTRITSFFTSEAFTSGFPDLVRRIHEVSVALARGQLAEVPNVYIEDGEVRLNLIPLMGQALQGVAEDLDGFIPDLDLPAVISDRLDEGREQLAEALQTRLPEKFGQVVIMSEESLGALQTAAVWSDRLVWALLGLTVALIAAVLILSPSRRRSIAHLGLGIVIALVVALLAMGWLERAFVDSFRDPAVADSVPLFVAELVGSLRATMVSIAVIAVLVIAVAYLAGRPSSEASS
jgi:hypothetical protein